MILDYFDDIFLKIQEISGFETRSMCLESILYVILWVTSIKNPRNRQISMSRVGLKKILSKNSV